MSYRTQGTQNATPAQQQNRTGATDPQGAFTGDQQFNTYESTRARRGGKITQSGGQCQGQGQNESDEWHTDAASGTTQPGAGLYASHGGQFGTDPAASGIPGGFGPGVAQDRANERYPRQNAGAPNVPGRTQGQGMPGEYAEANHPATTTPTTGSKVKSSVEKAAGRVTGNPDMVARGEERKLDRRPGSGRTTRSDAS